MTTKDPDFVEALDKLGHTVWINGKPYGKTKNGGLVGQPKCSNCENTFELGITTHSNQHICRTCLDELRRLLFDLLHEKYPDLFKRRK